MSGITTAVILASGLGNRLKPLTLRTPKPLIKVGGCFLIEYTLENLKSAGVQRAIITTRPFGEQFPKKLGTSYRGIDLIYRSLPQNFPPLGTAGDLKATEDLLQEGEPFLVCNSDIVTDLDLKEAIKDHLESGCSATIALVKKNPREYPASIGINEKGNITRLHRNIYGESIEKYTFACQHILTRNLLRYIPKNRPWGFFGDNDLYPTLVQKKISINTYIYPPGTYWEDVGTLERLKKVERHIKTGRFKPPKTA